MSKLKTSWDLGLLYKNDKDPQIERDLKTIEKVCADFEKKYKMADFTATPQKLFKALEDREELRRKIGGTKPWWYFALRSELNSEDAVATAKSTKFDQRIMDATNKIIFFNLNIGKISKTNQSKFLQHVVLQPYKYALKRIFERARYSLSESEEQVIDIFTQTSYTMWVDGQQKILNQQDIEYKGKKIPVTKASAMLSDLPTPERRNVQGKINTVLKSISHFAEAEINAVYNYKKALDVRRGYKKPYSATILGYENNEKQIESFIQFVTKNFNISRRFYKIHAKLLKEKKITYADRSAKIGDIKKKFDFETSTGIVRSTFGKIDKKFSEILNSFLKNRQLDVYPKKGKSGGAFCWGMGQLPTFVLLNHTDDINSVETLAHEMGHAIHTELSKSQPPRYRKYSTSTAEVASTFFEQAVTAELENHLTKDEQIILIHNKIKGDISTVFRQVACYNFELELHEKIREEGQISKENIASLLSKHMKSYLGDAVDVTLDDGFGFVQWSHIRRFFYVYSYAYGQLISRALFEKWKKDPEYSKKIEQFLSAGSSMSPEDIFKNIGIDTSKTAFFEEGLKGIENDIKKLEKLVKNI